MREEVYSQFKVWAFLKRNEALISHDEYRAGHVGFHCGNTRRLKSIRGYAVNIHDENSGLSTMLESFASVGVRNEPEHFLSMWDGFPAVHFDSWQHWIEAGIKEPTRASAHGLVVDADWTIEDGPFVFDRVSGGSTQFRSYHTRIAEHVIKPIFRAETRPSKLLQFFRSAPDLSPEIFSDRLLAEYAPLCADLEHLNGLVINLRDRDIDAAVRGYYPDDHWCFTEDGQAHRQAFFNLWDGANEFFFDNSDDFMQARQRYPAQDKLRTLEDELFEAVWFVSVDENVIVMPNRRKAPPSYYR